MDSQAWPHAACVRLFHSSGDVGCRVVTRLAQKLPLVSVDSLEALERALSSMDEELVAIVMKDSLLSAKAVEMFTSSKKVGGVVLVRTLASGSSVSPDVTTPQGKNTPSSAMDIDSDFIWNPMGSGLMSLSLSFPVVLLEGETAAQAWAGGIANLVRGVQKYPRSSAAFDFYFGAEGLSSLECLQWVNLTGMRSPKCLPIGGQSAWGTAGPPDGRPLVLLTSGMDSSSLFHDRVPGVNSAISGLVALLLAAEALGSASSNLHLELLPTQIGFGAFNAEAWGFTGSSRFVHDAWGGDAGFSCNNSVSPDVSPTGLAMCLDPLYPSMEFMKLGLPQHILAVDQVALPGPNGSLYVHPSPTSVLSDVQAVLMAGKGLGLSVSTSSVPEVPPSPLTSFLRHNMSLHGMVLSGYDAAFEDNLYHSHWENQTFADANILAAVGQWLAKSAYILAGGDPDTAAKEIHSNVTQARCLLSCMSRDWDCDLFRPYIVGELGNMARSLNADVSLSHVEPPSFYAGTLQHWGNGGLPLVRRYTHAHLKGAWDEVARTAEPWDPSRHAIFMVPSPLEIFVRAFLSDMLGSSGTASLACTSSPDCSSMPCGAARAECLRGRCKCKAAFYHIAMDTGLERNTEPGYYRVVDPNQPLWTEPYWDRIGVYGYLDFGAGLSVATLIAGCTVTAVTILFSCFMLRRLYKMKLL